MLTTRVSPVFAIALLLFAIIAMSSTSAKNHQVVQSIQEAAHNMVAGVQKIITEANEGEPFNPLAEECDIEITDRK